MPAGTCIAEAGIEEARVMHAKLAHQRVEGHHLGGVIGRHLHRLFRGEDVELAGIENETALPARAHRLPEITDVITGAALDVDDPGVALGAVADQAIRTKPGEVDAHGDAFAHVGVAVIDQALARVQRAQGFAVEQRIAVAEANLRQTRALAHQHRKGARTDLRVQRSVIAGGDMVEAAGLVGDDTSEDIEPAGRAFGIRGRRDVVGKREAFDQRYDVDATGFEHGPVTERDLVQLQLVDTLSNGRVRTRQKAGAHAVCHFAEPEIETCRLDLIGDEIITAQNGAIANENRDHVVGQDTVLVDC